LDFLFEWMFSLIKNWFVLAKTFLLDVRAETKRVTWLGLRHTMGQTAVALVFVFLISIYLGLIDIGLSRLINLILSIHY